MLTVRDLIWLILLVAVLLATWKQFSRYERQILAKDEEIRGLEAWTTHGFDLIDVQFHSRMSSILNQLNYSSAKQREAIRSIYGGVDTYRTQITKNDDKRVIVVQPYLREGNPEIWLDLFPTCVFLLDEHRVLDVIGVDAHSQLSVEPRNDEMVIFINGRPGYTTLGGAFVEMPWLAFNRHPRLATKRIDEFADLCVPLELCLINGLMIGFNSTPASTLADELIGQLWSYSDIVIAHGIPCSNLQSSVAGNRNTVLSCGSECRL